MVNQQKKKDLLQLLLGFIAILILNIFAQYAFTRFDFTKEKRFTLSPVSIHILEELKEPVQITVYLKGEFPSGFKRLGKATHDLLADYQSYANGNLKFAFIDPIEGKNQQEQEEVYQSLQQKGIEATNLSVKTENGLSQKVIYPAAIVSLNGKEIPVKLLQTRIGL